MKHISKEFYSKIFIKTLQEYKNMLECRSELEDLGVHIENELTERYMELNLLVLLSGTRRLKECEDFIYWWLFEDVDKKLYTTETKEVYVDLNTLEDFADFMVDQYYLNEEKDEEVTDKEFEQQLEDLIFPKNVPISFEDLQNMFSKGEDNE